MKQSLKGFQGLTAPAMAFEAHTVDLINLSRQIFSQGELMGGRNYNYN